MRKSIMIKVSIPVIPSEVPLLYK